MKELFKNLAAFQQEVKAIHKGSQGYGYKFADLPKIFETINPLMQKHGLGFAQMINSHEGQNYLVTIVFHCESGEKLESSTLIPNVQLAKMNEHQCFGSGITYYRRYCLSSILGLVTDVDNDASGNQVLDTKRFKAAVEKIQNGEFTREALEARFELTKEQISILNENGI
jgi:outer membrane protein assembly factor BamA